MDTFYDKWKAAENAVLGNRSKYFFYLLSFIQRTGDYYKELSGYTREYFPFEVRENAFGYLYQLNAFSDQNLLDLLKATQHHTYKFRDFSRKLLDTLLKDEEYRKSYVALREQISGKELEFLNTKLNL